MSKKNNNEPIENEVLETQVPNMFQPQAPVMDSSELINAINVLISAANVAQAKGVYNLEESHDIWDNIQIIHKILQPNQ